MVRIKTFGCALLLAAACLPAWSQQNQKDVVNNADIEAMKRANAAVPPQSSFSKFSAPPPGTDFLPPQDNSTPEQKEAWKKYQETKRDWTLMTPGEILNIPTPEKMLGIQDPNDDPSLSPEERFLKRLDSQTQKAQAARQTNSMNPIRPDYMKDRNPFANPQENVFRQNDAVSGTNGSNARNTRNNIWNANVFQNPTLELQARRLIQNNPLWDNAFNHAPTELKPDQDEKDAMDRFQAILNPPAPPPLPQTPTLDTPNNSMQPVDPNMQVMPAFNPDGSTFAPLQLLGSRPTGLMPIQGPESRHLIPTPAPAWTPKTPPWMSKGPGAQGLGATPPPMPQRIY